MKNIRVLHTASTLRSEAIYILDSQLSGNLSEVKEWLEVEGFNNISQGIEATKKYSLVIAYANTIDSAEFGYKNILSRHRAEYPDIPIIIISDEYETKDIVEAMRLGAYNFFHTPIDRRIFVLDVVRALERKVLMDALSLASGAIDLRYNNAFSHIITNNKKMKDIFIYLEQVYNTPHPILIVGETGTGKELIAKSIYNLLNSGEFVTLNIAGVDDTVFSDTLYGHVRGAYTGADGSRDGMVSRANDGMLFLDEIGDLSDASQVKLLRLIQEGEYYPLGADKPEEFTGKLVLATNIDLHKAVVSGKFREDLYFRIKAHIVHIPPLRERLDDLSILLSYFIDKSAKNINKKMPHNIPPELITLLQTYSFPGNIRELETMVMDAVARHKHGTLSMSTFYEKINSSKGEVNLNNIGANKVLFSFSKFPTLKDIESALIEKALHMSDNNQGIAASLLGISRQALNKRLNKDKK